MVILESLCKIIEFSLLYMRFFQSPIFLILFLQVFIFSSCSFKQQQILFEKSTPIPNINTALPSNSGNGTSDYLIRSQDILQIRNLQNRRYIVDEGTSGGVASSGSSAGVGQSYQVDDDGNVVLPIIGSVHVAGLSRAAAAKQIEDIYRKTELVNPIIELKIVNLKVTILGEIKGQGNYAIVKDRTSLVEMIGEAGGLTTQANEKNIKIIRGDPKNPEITEVDLGNIKTLADPRIILQNNDIIYISQNKRAIKNDQLQNFTTTLSPILLGLNTALIIYTLIHR